MIQFGGRIEMLVDDYLLAETENVVFRKTEPRPLGKVIGFDAPWEGLGSLGMTIFDDGEQIRCYYRGFPSTQSDLSERQTSCLSVSTDGLTFTPYPVNTIEYDGIRENNIVRMDVMCHNFAPFYDANPACRPDERYKAIGGLIQTGGISVFASPDGIHWHPMADHPVITKGAFDSMNMAFWNPATGKYHCYFRYMDFSLKSETMPYGCRAIQSCTSEDFIHWTEPVPNEYEEGHPTDQFYTNATRPVPGAEHILVSIPMRFQEARTKVLDYNGNVHGSQGVSDAVFMTSRDGVFWDRTLKDAWLSGSLYEHEWTQRNFITLGGIVERGDQFYIYTMKNYMWDDDGIWAYSVPKYRFLSLYADRTGGSFTTKPLCFTSDDLYLNYSTSAYGSVQVTIRDETGAEIYASDEIFGNELSYPLHIDGLTGCTGTMTVRLCEAHVYALGSRMQ
ncbi:MAG: hypothetical protein IJB20_00930 [Clostridia bacterium]|nr:hypothetical protein [Clostridia bacterium]